MNERYKLKEIPYSGKFIVFPVDGDNEGHGGYKTAYWLFQKVSTDAQCTIKNHMWALRLIDGILTELPENMDVIQIK